MDSKIRDIGIDVNPPASTCEDPHCPFHGTISVRGRMIDGKVVSTKMDRTAVVEKTHLRYQNKYERYEKRTGRYSVHAPPCMEIRPGDEVRIMECRPISKTVSFVAIDKR